MNDFYDFATLLIDKEKIEKVIQRKASIIQRAFEEKHKSPERIISLEFHSILVDFALQGLDVSYISENEKLIKYVDSLCKEFDVKINETDAIIDVFLMVLKGLEIPFFIQGKFQKYSPYLGDMLNILIKGISK